MNYLLGILEESQVESVSVFLKEHIRSEKGSLAEFLCQRLGADSRPKFLETDPSPLFQGIQTVLCSASKNGKEDFVLHTPEWHHVDDVALLAQEYLAQIGYEIIEDKFPILSGLFKAKRDDEVLQVFISGSPAINYYIVSVWPV